MKRNKLFVFIFICLFIIGIFFIGVKAVDTLRCALDAKKKKDDIGLGYTP